MDSHPITNPEDPRHGTKNGYANYGCRCDKCRQAWTEYRRQLRQRNAA